MSGLPKAVQQQLDEAERIEQQLAAPPAPPADPQAQPVNPPQEPQPAAPQPVEPQPAPQPAEPSQDAAYWRARFETIEGKYKAEVPRLAHALQETQQSLAQVRGQIEAVRQPAPAAPQPATLVTEKDDEKFGTDLVDLMRRVAREEGRSTGDAVGRIEQLIRQYAPQFERVKQVEQQVVLTREGQFYSDLARDVPDWETVNKDARWLDWLKEYDPVAGRTRQQSLDEAAGVFDTRRVVAMFKLFKTAQPAPQPSPQAKAQSELARQVAPSRSATATVAPQGVKTYTGADYAYWTDYRRIHDTAKEILEAKLAEMEVALAEGRVKF